MSVSVTLPRKVLRFGDEEIDISNSEFDQHPYPEQYRRVLYAFVRDTVAQCGFYRERMARADIKPEQITTQEAFDAIPPMSSGEVSSLNDSSLLPDLTREHLKKGFYGVPLEHKLWRKFTSSGSSGLRPKVSYYTREDWDVLTTAAARLHSTFLPLNRISRMFNCFSAAHVGAKFQEDSFSLLGLSVEGAHMTRTTPEAVLDQMMTSGASELGGFNALAIPPGLPTGAKGTSKGTNLDSLLNLDMDNFIGKNIRVIITSGSARDVPGLNLKERVWEGNAMAGVEKTKFFEMYGYSESLPNAMDCEFNEGLHLAVGPTFTEVLDEKTGKHVKNGERGLVVITGIRSGSRFIRYAVGDEATYVTGTCHCGRASPRLVDIQRVEDMERLQQGCAGGL
jgi:phenylacetate-CoA ligase